MSRFYKIYFILALTIISIFTVKIIFEFTSIQKIKHKSVEYEAKALADLVISFRKTYQNIFVKNHTKLDKTTFNFLPVRTINEISNIFAQRNTDVIIKTVSDNPRNQVNLANKRQMEAIEYFKNNKDQEYLFISKNDKYYYSQPLLISQICLKCHGDIEDAPKIISENYTAAYGYKLGEVRGILDIELSHIGLADFIENTNNKRFYSALLMLIVILAVIFIFIVYLKKYDEEKVKHQESLLFEQTKMASLGEMIGNIAHQWRQPLNVISAASTGLKMQKEFGMMDDKIFIESLDSINKNAQYLSSTINTFRDFIKEKKEFKEVILQDRIKIALDIVNTTLRNNHIKLKDNIDYDNQIKIELVVGELSQVIINIINNAKDILLETNIQIPMVTVDLIKEDDKVTITIEDNGGGIPDDIMPRIFEPYFTTKSESHGTGLELHMSQRIITESLHGKLYAKNTKNGAKFFIELPM